MRSLALSLLVALGLIWPQMDASAFEPLSEREQAVSIALQDMLQAEESYMSLGLQQPALTAKFYLRGGFRPVWTDGAKPKPDALEMREAIFDSIHEGLSPDYYRLTEIESGIIMLTKSAGAGAPAPAESVAWLDILLTDAFFSYAQDLLHGRVKPDLVIESGGERAEMELTGFLMRMLRVGWFRDALKDLAPKNPEYKALRAGLARYRKIAAKGGLPAITTQMRKGDRSPAVEDLRERLRATGDLESSMDVGGELFDVALEKALQRFQRRHGIEADGSAGPMTLKAINIPVLERIRTIELNLERLRWIPGAGDEFVFVNITDYSLKAVRSGHVALSMRVIIGKDYQKTPSFTAKLTSLVINPVWNIPGSIAREEMLPHIINDTSYLDAHNIGIVRGWGPEEQLLKASEVDLNTIGQEGSELRLRQSPGGENPLGNYKFAMPNRFDIYLHDTPAGHLFERETRAMSHGCIRVELPLDLAAFLMAGDKRWGKTRLQAAAETRDTYELNLPRPVDVFVLYLTAWAGKDGTVQFRDDIYGKDKPLDDKLSATLLSKLPVPKPR